MTDITLVDHSQDVFDHNFDHVTAMMQKSFLASFAHGPVFKTNASNLFDIYLNHLPVGSPEERQYHNCSECRKFFKQYGNLAVVDDGGALRSVMWQIFDGGFYQPAIEAVRAEVEKAKIISAFHSDMTFWGTPETDGWTHYAIDAAVFRDPADRGTSNRRMALSVERRRIVVSSFADIKTPVLDEALRVLKSDSLHRSDRFIGPVQWLRDLHDLPKGPYGTNLLWKAVTTAPEGYCHPRSSVTATLFEDIEKGMSFEDISRRWSKKVHPLQYQRPQAAPSSGTIVQAEKLVAELGIAKSLERRFARLDEVRTMWKPKELAAKEEADSGGVFAHLQPKDTSALQQVALPSKVMTWEKFVEKVLPTAQQMKILVPRLGNFRGVLTAQHEDAPPILKWDHEGDRYPISSYTYVNGSDASTWSLNPGWAQVDALVPMPNETSQVARTIVLVINGAKDRNTNQGNGLFPEILKSDLHSVRSVIEAYSRTALLGGREEASANGLAIHKDNASCKLRVYDGSSWVDYQIDRWE